MFGKAVPRCLGQLSKFLILVVLDYAVAVWDPPHRSISKLWSEFSCLQLGLLPVTGQTNPASLRTRLNWPLLSTRRHVLKLTCLCYCVLNVGSLLASSVFNLLSRPSKRCNNSKSLFWPIVRTHMALVFSWMWWPNMELCSQRYCLCSICPSYIIAFKCKHFYQL